jgi:hypothetical protein
MNKPISNHLLCDTCLHLSRKKTRSGVTETAYKVIADSTFEKPNLPHGKSFIVAPSNNPHGPAFRSDVSCSRFALRPCGCAWTFAASLGETHGSSEPNWSPGGERERSRRGKGSNCKDDEDDDDGDDDDDDVEDASSCCLYSSKEPRRRAAFGHAGGQRRE